MLEVYFSVKLRPSFLLGLGGVSWVCFSVKLRPSFLLGLGVFLCEVEASVSGLGGVVKDEGSGVGGAAAVCSSSVSRRGRCVPAQCG